MIDFSIWDLKTKFTLLEASCLWFNREPCSPDVFEFDPKQMITQQIIQIGRELCDAASSGKLTGTPIEQDMLIDSPLFLSLQVDINSGNSRRLEEASNKMKSITLNDIEKDLDISNGRYLKRLLQTSCSRDTLKKFATEIGHKPLFLFPEEREKQSEQQQEKAVFICPEGTEWKDVTITLIAGDTVRIKTPQKEEKFQYSEIGLSDKRKGDSPTAVWDTLKMFCVENGCISSEDGFIEDLPDKAKYLNKHLKELFGIKDSIYSGHYNKEKRYQTKINFRNQTELRNVNGGIKAVSSKEQLKLSPTKATVGKSNITCKDCEDTVRKPTCSDCGPLVDECLQCHNENHHADQVLTFSR